MDVRGREVLVETSLEIITKKLVYRGSHIQPRDMFDIAAVVMQQGSDELSVVYIATSENVMLPSMRLSDLHRRLQQP